MPTDYIRYDILTQEALRGVLRTVLADAAAKGLPGDHHFYVSFDTRALGVQISPRLAAQYPDEMTIVLQHQFWDLVVTDERFEVGLSFHGVPEKLVVPFSAIKGFFDPSVQFGLEFAVQAELATEDGEEKPHTPVSALPGRITGPDRPPAQHKRPPASVPEIAAPVATASPEDDDDPPPDRGGGGEVVRLDRFRKK